MRKLHALQGHLLPAATVVLTALYASPSLACAVCFDAKGENRWAFLGTTALLTFLPLGVIGGTAWWLRKRVLEAAAAEAEPATVTPAEKQAGSEAVTR